MCLIAFAWRVHPRHDLIVAANRDEFHDRPACAAHWWADAPAVFGGRDGRAGGAWCAADRSGRLAAVTNVREAGRRNSLRSRGALVHDLLAEPVALTDYVHQIAQEAQSYGPFNLLLADRNDLWFVSNRGSCRQLRLPPGVYAISNGHWDEEWPKTRRASAALTDLINADQVSVNALLDLLADRSRAPGHASPNARVGPHTEQFLSSLFIRGDAYGTRASTVVLRGVDGNMVFHERGFDRHADIVHDMDEHWSIG